MSKVIKSPHAMTTKIETRKISIQNQFKKVDFEADSEADSDAHVMNKIESEKVMEVDRYIKEMQFLAEKRANEIIKNAESDAQKIKEQLKKEEELATIRIEDAVKAGHEQGYKEGYKQGEQNGKNTYDNLISKAMLIVRESELEFDKTIDSAGPDIVELSVALVKKVIGQRLEVDPEIWSSFLKQIMEEVREHEHVKLYVHPDWYVQTTGQREELEQLISRTENLYIYPDAGLTSNGCVVESKYGRIDATLDRQLHELKSQLLEKWKEGGSEDKGTNE